jgi:hypothetical protein
VVVAFGLVSLQTARHEVIVTLGTRLPHPCAMRPRMNGAPKMILWVGHPPPKMILWVGHPPPRVVVVKGGHPT